MSKSPIIVVSEEDIEVLEVAMQGPPGAQGQTGPTGPAGGVALQLFALADLGGHRGVVVDSDNKVFYADTTNPQHLGRVSGVTLHAVVAGGVVTVVRTGPIYEPSWNWVPDQAVYLADNGLLTQTPPTGFFQQVIGVAIDSTSLYVNLRPPLVVT